MFKINNWLNNYLFAELKCKIFDIGKINGINWTYIFGLFLGWDFSILSGITVTFLYTKLFMFIMKNFKECFTLGEAGLASQAALILLYSLIINIMSFAKDGMVFRSNMQIATVIIQVSHNIPTFFLTIFILFF